MEYNIDKYKIINRFVYIKGWAHFDKYKIKVVVNNNMNFIFEPNESRYDICMNFHEKIMDNFYGFVIEEELNVKIKRVQLFLLTGSDEIEIFDENITMPNKIYRRMRKILSKIKRGIKFLWREYHFLVPPTMIKKYIKDFFGHNLHQSILYDPTISKDYNLWYQTQVENYIETPKLSFSYVVSSENISIENTNLKLHSIQEIEKLSTEYICYIDGNVSLEKNFPYYMQEIIEKKHPDLIYCDHDYINVNGEYYNPNLKPDFSYDTLMGVNYIGNLFIIKTSLFQKINCAKAYEILLNVTTYTKNIEHISKVLYHEQENDNSHNFEILQNFIEKKNINAIMEKNSDNETVTLIYQLKEEPKVSIIIPTKDHADILETCLKSIYEKTTYKNYEVIVIDNNSSEEATFELLKKYKKKKNFRVERLECKFNYSYINNYAIKHFSSGEYILLLNNDTEVITPNWLNIMVGYASQSHIGAVGAKLLFPDDTIQHAGIIMGKGGLAGHINYGKPRNYQSYRWDLKIPYNYAGCTAACLMVSRKKYGEVDGLEESLEVAFNDVDFNLKLLTKGYYNVFLPNVELYHYESKSRGLDTTPEKQKRFVSEWSYMKEKWNDIIEKDPYYNDNYSKNEDYMLK